MPACQSVNPCCPSMCACAPLPPVTGQTLGVHPSPTQAFRDSFHGRPSVFQPVIWALSQPLPQRRGTRGPPQQRGPPSWKVLLYPQTSDVLVEVGVGALLLLSWRGRIFAFSLLSSFPVFSVSSFAQTCEHWRADGFQTGTRP